MGPPSPPPRGTRRENSDRPRKSIARRSRRRRRLLAPNRWRGGRMTCGPPCEAGNKNACSGDLPSPPGRRVKTRKRDCRWLVSRLVRHKNPYTALRDGYRCGLGGKKKKKEKIFRFFPVHLSNYIFLRLRWTIKKITISPCRYRELFCYFVFYHVFSFDCHYIIQKTKMHKVLWIIKMRSPLP